MATASKNTKNFYRNTIILAVLAGLLLFIASSAVWVNRYIFDRQSFTQVAVTSLSSESSRNAIAAEVADRALGEAPLVQQALGGTVEKVVSGILGTDQFKTVLTKSVNAMHVYFTTENRKTIGVDLTSTKQVINTVLGALQRAGQNESQALEKVNSVPDQIIILDKDTLPSFYKQSVALMWIGPIAGLVAAALLVIPYAKNVRRYMSIAAIQGAAIALFGMIAMLVGPLFKPPVLANIETANARIVVENLYNAFIATFNAQSNILVVAGLLMIVAVLVIYIGQNIYTRYLKDKKLSTKKS